MHPNAEFRNNFGEGIKSILEKIGNFNNFLGRLDGYFAGDKNKFKIFVPYIVLKDEIVVSPFIVVCPDSFRKKVIEKLKKKKVFVKKIKDDIFVIAPEWIVKKIGEYGKIKVKELKSVLKSVDYKLIVKIANLLEEDKEEEAIKIFDKYFTLILLEKNERKIINLTKKKIKEGIKEVEKYKLVGNIASVRDSMIKLSSKILKILEENPIVIFTYSDFFKRIIEGLALVFDALILALNRESYKDTFKGALKIFEDIKDTSKEINLGDAIQDLIEKINIILKSSKKKKT